MLVVLCCCLDSVVSIHASPLPAVISQSRPYSAAVDRPRARVASAVSSSVFAGDAADRVGPVCGRVDCYVGYMISEKRGVVVCVL